MPLLHPRKNRCLLDRFNPRDRPSVWAGDDAAFDSVAGGFLRMHLPGHGLPRCTLEAPVLLLLLLCVCTHAWSHKNDLYVLEPR